MNDTLRQQAEDRVTKMYGSVGRPLPDQLPSLRVLDARSLTWLSAYVFSESMLYADWFDQLLQLIPAPEDRIWCTPESQYEFWCVQGDDTIIPNEVWSF